MARKVKYDFNPFQISGIPLRGNKRVKALREVKDFVLEQVLSKVGRTQSPVSGEGSFKSLDKDYKKLKIKKGGRPIANLELTGKLTSGIKVIPQAAGLRLTTTQTQQPKADGHNNFSGKSPLPRRQFVPDVQRSQTFKKDIIAGIKRIVKRNIG